MTRPVVPTPHQAARMRALYDAANEFGHRLGFLVSVGAIGPQRRQLLSDLWVEFITKAAGAVQMDTPTPEVCVLRNIYEDEAPDNSPNGY